MRVALNDSTFDDVDYYDGTFLIKGHDDCQRFMTEKRRFDGKQVFNCMIGIIEVVATTRANNRYIWLRFKFHEVPRNV